MQIELDLKEPFSPGEQLMVKRHQASLWAQLFSSILMPILPTLFIYMSQLQKIWIFFIRKEQKSWLKQLECGAVEATISMKMVVNSALMKFLVQMNISQGSITTAITIIWPNLTLNMLQKS